MTGMPSLMGRSSTMTILRPLTGILQRLPASWRARLALAAPRLPIARPISEQYSAYDIAYWEQFYAKADPWGFVGDKNEEVKYALTLDLCGDGPFDRALEIGCGEGLFTQMLAPRCRSLLAVDISSRAVRRAQVRLSNHPGVLTRAMSLPVGYPEGPFDLLSRRTCSTTGRRTISSWGLAGSRSHWPWAGDSWPRITPCR